jgi:hypothetical protein
VENAGDLIITANALRIYAANSSLLGAAIAAAPYEISDYVAITPEEYATFLLRWAAYFEKVALSLVQRKAGDATDYLVHETGISVDNLFLPFRFKDGVLLVQGAEKGWIRCVLVRRQCGNGVPEAGISRGSRAILFWLSQVIRTGRICPRECEYEISRGDRQQSAIDICGASVAVPVEAKSRQRPHRCVRARRMWLDDSSAGDSCKRNQGCQGTARTQIDAGCAEIPNAARTTETPRRYILSPSVVEAIVTDGTSASRPAAALR